MDTATEMFRQVVLEKLSIQSFQAVSPAMLHNADVDIVATVMADELLVALRSFVMAEQVDAVSKTFCWPLDWWQAFKARWFPAWVKRRWPVLYRTEHVVLKRYVSFPESKHAWPKAFGRPVVVFRNESFREVTSLYNCTDEGAGVV